MPGESGSSLKVGATALALGVDEGGEVLVMRNYPCIRLRALEKNNLALEQSSL